ncbi:xanthine dehydrogenase [Polymorphobacter glacialis]|uniref:Xanthine dehydrogenase n=1 Tax=Sandarakinorhabdus glacialis TaxID=1614636 RepID=A0A916ZK10_9SPHN|nr:xanthine dehydrogenase family protein molybdopterin-binding subunit [Polymorphobacter glacialis]GGE00476.1 xanthine dehydrogenase [Polymorphobacter glacialis]
MTNTLTMDKPDVRNRLDAMAQGIIGAPLDRPEGPLKVVGTATYASEWQLPDMAYGVFARATVPAGKVASIDREAVLAMPGVLAIHDDPRMLVNPAQGGAGKKPLQDIREIHYFGQTVALVVAETFEQATAAAKALKVEYAAPDDASVFDPESSAATVEHGPDTQRVQTGDLDKAMADAAFSVDVTYTTAGHASAAMEPHASIASWQGDQLTLRGSLQMLNYNVAELADSLAVGQSQVRILSPYVGGGFGSKLGVGEDSVAAAIASRELGRPVRVDMSRQQVFETVMRRSETRQRLRLAARADGVLTGIGHECLVSNLPGEQYAEPVTQATEFLYGGENRMLSVDVARIVRLCAGSVRAPGEAVGMQALESAMDELAEKVGIDPVELRKRNIPAIDPSQGTPYSSNTLAKCLDAGAARFGWDQRQTQTCATREGEWWIGMGVASAARVHKLVEASARVTLASDGTVKVETDMTDIGTGTYAVLGQIAGEMLGTPIEKVSVCLGDSALPAGPGSGGSWGAASSGSAVFLACEQIRQALAKKFQGDEEALSLKDGIARLGEASAMVVDLVAGKPIVGEGTIKPGETSKATRQASYGAFFAEVAVNAYTGETRVRRMTGAFGIGRVLNEKTATSQCYGGMTWSIGSALTEELAFDLRDGHLVNHDLAEYHVPVNLDVPALEVVFVEERDPHASPIQAKGVGELGICGGAGAIANAIYNACGVRVRDFPMTLDKIIGGLPD